MRLNDIVPNFKAATTRGVLQFYEWQGDAWVVLFSHPADFTPVCTTEIGRLTLRMKEFEKRNVKILAHSVDRLETHMEWLKDVQVYCMDIPPPIIADEHRELALLLDLLDLADQGNTLSALTGRVMYIIGPDHRIKFCINYPATVGRDLNEVLRVIDALQITEGGIVETPANWRPEGDLLINAAVSNEEASTLFPMGYDNIVLPSCKNYLRTVRKPLERV